MPTTLRSTPKIAQPLPGEMLAIDPRLPATSQRFEFTLDANGRSVHRVVWQVDGKPLPESGEDTASWVLVPGPHRVSAKVWMDGVDTAATVGPVEFSVVGPGSNPG